MPYELSVVRTAVSKHLLYVFGGLLMQFDIIQPFRLIASDAGEENKLHTSMMYQSVNNSNMCQSGTGASGKASTIALLSKTVNETSTIKLRSEYIISAGRGPCVNRSVGFRGKCKISIFL
jgi:hypothetical protein